MGVFDVDTNVLNWVAQVLVRASLQQCRPQWKLADECLPNSLTDFVDHME